MSQHDGADRVPGPDRRWPRSVYGVGEEPDPRVSLANERTFLAWVRTALALIAAGVALTAFGEVTRNHSWSTVSAALLLTVSGVGCGIGSLRNWIRTERAIRLGRPLPATPLVPVAAGVLVLFGLVAIALAI